MRYRLQTNLDEELKVMIRNKELRVRKVMAKVKGGFAMMTKWSVKLVAWKKLVIVGSLKTG